MKRIILVSMCAVGISMNGMEKQLKTPLLSQGDTGDVELREVAIEPGTPGAVRALFPVTPIGSGVGQPGLTPEHSMATSGFMELSSEHAAQLEAHPEVKIKLAELLAELKQHPELLADLKEGHEENSLSTKKRVIASILELAGLTVGTAFYSYYLSNPGFDNSAIFQHYTARSYIRNFKNFSNLAKVLAGLGAIGLTQLIDYHVFLPYLGHNIGIGSIAIFFTLGVLVETVAQTNPVKKSSETICQTMGRVGFWLKNKFKKSA